EEEIPRAVGARAGRMFEAHGPMVFALCNLLLGNRQEAEDALQQTFLSGYRSMLDGTVPEEPAAWLAAIARNECMSRLRRRTPEPVRLRDAEPAQTRTSRTSSTGGPRWPRSPRRSPGFPRRSARR